MNKQHTRYPSWSEMTVDEKERRLAILYPKEFAAWCELTARELDEAIKFYRALKFAFILARDDIPEIENRSE